MNPIKGAAAAASADAIVPEKLLNEGEVVILALKPSAWFLLLATWPAILVGGAVAIGTILARDRAGFDIDPRIILPLCAAMVLVQLFVACCQWVGRLYVLTNVRILRVRGVFRVDLFTCHLKRVKNTVLVHTAGERILGIGSLYFETETPANEPMWIHIAHPHEVQDMVREAISRAR